MSVIVYTVSAALVFVFSGLLAMAGLGAVERYARVKQGKIVCMPCAEKVGG